VAALVILFPATLMHSQCFGDNTRYCQELAGDLEQSPVIRLSVSKLYAHSLGEAPKFWLVAAPVTAVTCNRRHKSQSINCCWGGKLKCNGNDTIKLVPQRRLYCDVDCKGATCWRPNNSH